MDHKDHHTLWRPRETKGKIENPYKRWFDDIKRVADQYWTQTTQDRMTWKLLAEAYVQNIVALEKVTIGKNPNTVYLVKSYANKCK